VYSFVDHSLKLLILLLLYWFSFFLILFLSFVDMWIHSCRLEPIHIEQLKLRCISRHWALTFWRLAQWRISLPDCVTQAGEPDLSRFIIKTVTLH